MNKTMRYVTENKGQGLRLAPGAEVARCGTDEGGRGSKLGERLNCREMKRYMDCIR